MKCLFDLPQPEIKKKIRLIELFAGIGAQSMAMRAIGADFEIWHPVEFDEFAMKSYNAIHGTNDTTTDIRDIHGSDLQITGKDKYSYILFYSFPCTDLSVAGKMEGMSKKDWENGESTRSGLLWEVERLLKELPDEQLPDYLILENVPQLCSEVNMPEFKKWLDYLKSRGYFSYYDFLNAKDFGIPQNRERCFCVSILSKDFVEFEFPKKIPLKYVMKDFLLDDVDEKYFLRTEKAKKLIQQLIDDGKLD